MSLEEYYDRIRREREDEHIRRIARKQAYDVILDIMRDADGYEKKTFGDLIELIEGKINADL